MKTLLVDIDKAMLQQCLRRMGGRQAVEIATSKAQALMQLRHGAGFDAVVACERLEDGSGLALLGEVQMKFPKLIRVFCSERQRLEIVRTRLGALRLHDTLTYPLKAVKLEMLLVQLARGR